MPATVQIVDKVGSGGSVLLDLNSAAGGVRVGRRDDLELAAVEMAARAGDERFLWVPSPAGGAPVDLSARQVTVPVVMVAATADAAAVLAQRLQQLCRSRFILRLQRHGGSTPVWLRCAPTVPRLSSNVAGAGQPTRIVTGSITVQTEPYAIGARVDVGPATITQDPASGTPWVWDIDDVAGDSLTPLVLRSSDADVRGELDRIMVTIRRRGVPSSLTGLAAQAESGSTAEGTTPPSINSFTGDSAFSGGSGLRATYSTSGSGPWTVTVTFPSLAGVEAPGTYRLLVRCAREADAGGQPFTLVAQAGPCRLVEPFTAGGSDTRVIDMGLVQVPVAQPPYLSAPETPLAASAPSVSVAVVRAQAGAGAFVVDWVALVPADEDCGSLEVTQAAGSGVLALDGWDQQPRIFSADPFTGVSPSAVGATGLSFIGRVPRLRPGDNRLYIVAGLGLTVARPITASLTWSGSYWPRYGWLA
jgi:hypothetical protein